MLLLFILNSKSGDLKNINEIFKMLIFIIEKYNVFRNDSLIQGVFAH